MWWREVQGLELLKNTDGICFRQIHSWCPGPFSEPFPDTTFPSLQDGSMKWGSLYSHFRVGETGAKRWITLAKVVQLEWQGFMFKGTGP